MASAQDKTPTRTPDRRDKNGLPMSSCDLHIACRSCLRGGGQYCSRAVPCSVCTHWTEAMWNASEDAERRSAVKRDKRESKESGKSPASLMPPPKEVPKSKKLLRPSSSRRRDRSMGEDAEWSPGELHSTGATPQSDPGNTYVSW